VNFPSLISIPDIPEYRDFILLRIPGGQEVGMLLGRRTAEVVQKIDTVWEIMRAEKVPDKGISSGVSQRCSATVLYLI
jgi:hypothetical protein